MSSVDLNKLRDIKFVKEVYEVVGVWEFYIESCPKKLKIKVLKLPNGKYEGVANYKILNPRIQQADPYIGRHIRETVEEAIRDALYGFLTYWKPEHADEIELIENENF